MFHVSARTNRIATRTHALNINRMRMIGGCGGGGSDTDRTYGM
jgi:hypothetical protein